jgi:hypothetical protein
MITPRQRSLFDKDIVVPAIRDSFVKLDPRVQLRNPVMFIVEVGAVVALGYAVRDLRNGQAGFDVAISLWLWFTVLFANFAEAVAEGRGKAQAEFLRRTKSETYARRLVDNVEEKVVSSTLRRGDRVVAEAGDIIAADGEIVEGAASVDESAITGESAPVIREAGGDRSSVTGGTRVLSDRIVFVVSANPGESFLDRMISLVEGAQRQKTPNEIALSILLAGLTIVFIIAVATLAPFSLYAGSTPSVAPRLPDPDHDRRPTLGDRYRRDGPRAAAQRARDERTRGGSRRRRRHTAPRQDRHHHAGQPPGQRDHPRPRRRLGARVHRGVLRVARRRNAGRPLDRDPRGPDRGDRSRDQRQAPRRRDDRAV